MPVRMRLREWPVMDVLVMCVVDMRVVVFQRLVQVFVVVTLGQMQP